MGQASRPKRTYEETHKTKEERSAEIKNLLKKLSDLEITAKTPGMIDFLKHTKEFIDSCNTVEELKAWELMSKNNPELQEHYNNKLKNLKR